MLVNEFAWIVFWHGGSTPPISIFEKVNMRLNLLTYPHKKLRKKSKKVVDFVGLRPIIPNMLRIMRRDDGVALAAPQVGILKRFFVSDKKEMLNEVFINPTWKPSKESKLSVQQEGCLSLPGILFSVSRYDEIEVEYWDLDGQKHSDSLSGFSARIFQHETDHLSGRLMIDSL